MRNSIPNDQRPITRERAQAVMEQGRKHLLNQNLRRFLTEDEEAAVQRYWQRVAPAHWSFNTVIRECAR